MRRALAGARFRLRGLPARARRPRTLAALLLVALVTGGMSSPVVLNGRSLAVEWTRCLTGRAPAPQPELAERIREHAAARRPVPNAAQRPTALPIIEPRTVLGRSTPQADARPVVIAVLDSGVMAGHPHVGTGQVLAGADLINPCGDGRADVLGHGTAVAGVIASTRTGAAPEVQILPVRVTLATGRQHPWSGALGVVWAVRNGADIVNMSYSNPDGRPSWVERAAIAYAQRQEVALVAAAGNRPDRNAGYPAAYPGVVSVSAVDGDGRPSAFASRTGAVDLAAPGSRVLTLASDGTIVTASGTSLAAPLVSAAIARVLIARPDLTPAEAAEVVVAAAVHPDEGLPILDLHAALRAVCPPGACSR
jgi:membrane-anchored mycosin MYCP